mmetsp:Transcript_55225/g.171591  ORF Transcript_55225/g.171591 Transcript_55225/m.171591 type:complete len:365 (-) Transcript_55225:381-1475(-)
MARAMAKPRKAQAAAAMRPGCVAEDEAADTRAACAVVVPKGVVVPLEPPVVVSDPGVRAVVAVAGQQGVGEAEPHRGVVRPLPRLDLELVLRADGLEGRQVEPVPAVLRVHGLEKLKGRPEAVCNRQTDQCTHGSLRLPHLQSSARELRLLAEGDASEGRVALEDARLPPPGSADHYRSGRGTRRRLGRVVGGALQLLLGRHSQPQEVHVLRGTPGRFEETQLGLRRGSPWSAALPREARPALLGRLVGPEPEVEAGGGHARRRPARGRRAPHVHVRGAPRDADRAARRGLGRAGLHDHRRADGRPLQKSGAAVRPAARARARRRHGGEAVQGGDAHRRAEGLRLLLEAHGLGARHRRRHRRRR